ncbi:MAG: SRPBCC family protein, partial [Parafilimonas sp.]
FPSTVKVSRAIDIKAPPDSVYVLIADINNWSRWMEGAKNNSLEILSSDKNGKAIKARADANEITILTSTLDTTKTVWAGRNGEQQQSNFILFKNNRIKGTTLNWYFLEHVNWYPWERLSSMMNEKILGPQMEKSLENLKQIAEQR